MKTKLTLFISLLVTVCSADNAWVGSTLEVQPGPGVQNAFNFMGQTYVAEHTLNNHAWTTNSDSGQGVEEWETDATGTNFLKVISHTNCVLNGNTQIALFTHDVSGWTNSGAQRFEVDMKCSAACLTNISSYYSTSGNKVTFAFIGSNSITPLVVNTNASGSPIFGGITFIATSSPGKITVSAIPNLGTANVTNNNFDVEFWFKKL